MELQEHLDSLLQIGACLQVLEGDTVLPLGGFRLGDGLLTYSTPFPETQQDVRQVEFDNWDASPTYVLLSLQGETVAGAAAASVWAEIDLHEFTKIDAAWQSFLQTPSNLKEFMAFLGNA